MSNEAFYRKANRKCPVLGRIGPGIRLVQWNIERGLELDNIKLAFTDSETFVTKVKSSPLKAPDGEKREGKVNEKEIGKIQSELEILQAADVLVLNEVDWGMKRTDYRCVVCELGAALDMNWAWGVEFVEVDPTILGTDKFEEIEDQEERAKMIAATSADHSLRISIPRSWTITRPARCAIEPIPRWLPGWYVLLRATALAVPSHSE